MQVVILGAGKSTRTYPLTSKKPKPLLKVANKTIIERNLLELEGLVDEVIFVVGFHAEDIIEHLGDSFNSIKITYIEQVEQNGTGGALLTAKELLKEKFLVMNGDDVFSREDIKRCLSHETCILAKEVTDLERFGEVVVEGDIVVDLIEKPHKKNGRANTGLYVFNTSIFEHTLEKSVRGEYEITDYVSYLTDMKCEMVQEHWVPISYPWNVLEANEFFLKEMKGEILGDVEEGAILKGEVSVGKGTVVKSGAYIEGPVSIGENCVIGPNCYIRPYTSIGNNSKVGNAVDIKNSVLGDNTSVAHLSYIGDSVLGDRVNVAAGVVVANLRHDKENIKTPVKGEMMDTGKKKLGTFIGDHVNLGINTSIYPGRKIWSDRSTSPGETVTQDIE